MAEEDSPLILVTGASGYVATHLIQQLQQEGNRVRGKVKFKFTNQIQIQVQK